MKFRYTAIVLLLFVGVLLSARTIRFRSGQVMAAELSTAKIKVSDVHPDAPLKFPETPVYAVVSVKLDQGRTISIFDYTLDVFGSEFPCVAIRTGKDFKFTTDAVFSTGVIQLLFIADQNYVNRLVEKKLTLKSKLPPSKVIYSTEIPFTTIGSKKIMTPDAVSLEGAFLPEGENK